MKKHRGLHVIHGDDDYRKSLTAKALIDKFVPVELRDFNYDRIEGDAATEEDLCRIAQTPPLMAEYRMLHVDEAERLSDKATNALIEQMDATCDRTPNDVVFLLVYSPEKNPPQSILKRAGQVLEFKPLRWKEAQDWIVQYAKDKHGIKLSPAVVQALLKALGPPSSGRLANEIDKLKVLAGNAPISVQLVESATGVQVGKSVFDLCDAVGNKNIQTACQILGDVLRAPNNSAIGTIVLLGRHLMDIGIARAMLDRGDSPQNIAKNFGWTGNKIVAQAEKWTIAELDRTISLLADTDVRLKTVPSGPQSEWRVLNTFLISALK